MAHYCPRGGAQTDISKAFQKWLVDNLGEEMFWDETMRPPSSPDGNLNTWPKTWERLRDIIGAEDSNTAGVLSLSTDD